MGLSSINRTGDVMEQMPRDLRAVIWLHCSPGLFFELQLCPFQQARQALAVLAIPFCIQYILILSSRRIWPGSALLSIIFFPMKRLYSSG